LDKRADIYNDLVNWEQRKKLYTIHKRLLPFVYKETTCEDVNDFIQLLPFHEGAHILDIGCGVGYTLIQLALKRKISGLGISISSKEIEQANQNAAINHLTSDLRFLNQSFDEAINFKFAKAFAVESLKHSYNIEVTAENIFSSASPGSKIYIIDDFFMGKGQENSYAKTLKRDWNLTSLYTKEDFESAFLKAGFSKEERIDFTGYVLPKSKMLLKAKILIFSLMEKLTRSKSRRNLLAIFKSGFILELLFQQKLFTYECLVFSRSAKANKDFS
jgi:SAM-dependent methyltransferase